jgi:AraC-like DNA-binding protein
MFLNLIYFILFPSIILYTPFIVKPVFKKIADNSFNLLLLQSFFENEKKYLTQNLTITSVSKDLSLSVPDIRSSIRVGLNLNFNEFVNLQRINHSVKLMKSGYLDNQVMISLAEESGFNSSQTFYRAFKKVHKVTPSKFISDNLNIHN